MSDKYTNAQLIRCRFRYGPAELFSSERADQAKNDIDLARAVPPDEKETDSVGQRTLQTDVRNE